MNAVIRHRGPDDQGTYFRDNVGFGFRRLAILDLSPLGHQPMTSEDGRFTIVFNGEIYNYLELRSQLTVRGYTFLSSSDTEVLLNAFREWGADCLNRLNGMWAFLIHDAHQGVVFGSRDRFGIKPLYFHRSGDYILLASEIKSIRASGLYQTEVNWAAATDFLTRGDAAHEERDFLKGIEQIPAGTAFQADAHGAFKQWRYWSVPDIPIEEVTSPAERFAELFEDAMRLHMRSDVPVAVHLSGGLDSTAIACASARIRTPSGAQGPLTAFSFAAPEYDESPYIAETVRWAQAALNTLQFSSTALWDSLESTLWYHDEPVHSMTAVVGFALMKMTASQGIKVVLNGQGADETLAGYPNYFRSYWRSLISTGKSLTAVCEILAYSSGRGQSAPALLFREISALAKSRLGQKPWYRALKTRSDRLNAEKTRSWLSGDLAAKVPRRVPQSGRLGLTEVLTESVERAPLPLYLRIEDRNSMAHSVEARVPFLDHRLVSLAFNMPPSWLLRGPWNKFVLREAMRGKIPEKVRMRVDKMGFPTPTRRYFATDLYEPVRDLVGSRQFKEKGLFDSDAIMKDLERHRRGEVDVSNKLFNVAQFDLWHEMIRTPQTAPDDLPLLDPQKRGMG